MPDIFVKPKRGLVVRHPEKTSYILPDAGEVVQDSIIWRRYEKNGDVTITNIDSQKPKKSEGDK